MEAPIWPEELPCILLAGYDSELDAGVIRADQKGFARQRKRFRRTNTQIKISWVLDSDELTVFKDFFFQDTLAGALVFLIELKLDTGLEFVAARFVADSFPEYVAVESYWNVSALVEVLSAQFAANFVGDLRVTEEGERRVTEEGEVRTT